MDKPILLIPEKTDPDFEQVVKTWESLDGEVKRLGKYWLKDPSLDGRKIAVYGNQTFALITAQVYDVELISPDDREIAKLDRSWTKRTIEIKTIDELDAGDFPLFAKPVVPKSFPASVFDSLKDFESATSGLDKNEELLVSEIVNPIRAEARAYVKNGLLKELALYEGNADLETGALFLQTFVDEHLGILPEVAVIDIAYAEKPGWFVLEFNACWGAGLNNCRAEKVIDCIIGATKNPED